MPVPVCPHCKTELPSVSLFNWRMGPWVIMAVYCANQECRTVLHMQSVLVATGEEPSQISMPS